MTIRETIQRWIRPRASDPEEARREYMVNVILLGLFSLGFLFGLVSLIVWLREGGPWIGAVSGFSVLPVYATAYGLNHRGHSRAATYIVLGILFLVMLGGGLNVGIGHSPMVGYAMIITIAGLLLGVGPALFLTLLCGGSYALVGWLQIAGRLPAALSPEATLLTDVAAITTGLAAIVVVLWLASQQLRQALHTEQRLSTELRHLVNTLEQRVAERTADLARRSTELEAAAQVAREAAAIRDVSQLLNTTVHLISERFGFYHVGIFLVDAPVEYAVLQAASSEGGQRMLAHGHRLKVGEIGIVGYAAGSGQPRIALDVGEDVVFFNNPDLPETRSEMALPLRVRERVIGVLDVQSEKPAAFSEEDVAILQTLADQVALAIENARLLEESQRALRELEVLYGRRARQAWAERVTRQPAAYRYTGVGVGPVPPSLAQEMGALPPQHQPVIQQEGDGHRLIAPIRLREQTFGSIVLRQDPQEEPWSLEEVALVEELSTQIGLALENARLLEETQRRAAREQLASEVTARFRETLDLETILKTAVQEIRQALSLPEVVIRLVTAETDDGPTFP